MRLYETKQQPLVVHNPADILMKYAMKPGDYVSIAYVADILQGQSSEPIRTGRMYNINEETDAKLADYIDQLPANNLKKLLSAFRESSKYQDLLNGKGKTGKVDLSSEHIIKISHLTCNWKDAEGLAKFYDGQTQKEWQLRKDYGFDDGFEDPASPYDDENWRDKYNGRNIMPRIKGAAGNVYKDSLIIPGIYASLSNPNDIALRFAYNPKSSHTDSEYYYVNSDGTLFKMNYEFIAFLTYAYKQTKVNSDTVVPFDDNERQFVQKLKKLLTEAPSIAEITLKCDQVLFLKSTARDEQKNSVPFIWINADKIKKTYSFIDPREINAVIRGMVDDVDDTEINSDLENINIKGKSIASLITIGEDGRPFVDTAEARKILGIKEGMSYELHTSLYKDIMKRVSKSVKNALNEAYGDRFDVKGLRQCLRRFNYNGRYAKAYSWSIAAGGYDLEWQLYYDNVPIIDKYSGNKYIEVDTDDGKNNIDQVVKILLDEYPDCRFDYNEYCDE